MLSTSEVIYNLENLETLDFNQSFDYAQYCSHLLKTEEILGRKIIINALNNWHKISLSTQEMWVELVETSGFYPYLLKEECNNLDSIPALLRKELHRSENIPSRYFHEEQLELFKHLNTNKNVIVSAPTSFGKSLLVEEVIASKRYKNIVIIQPTLALLDETRRKLLK